MFISYPVADYDENFDCAELLMPTTLTIIMMMTMTMTIMVMMVMIMMMMVMTMMMGQFLTAQHCSIVLLVNKR